MRLMKIKYPHEEKLKDRLDTCLKMCNIPHVIYDDINFYTIFIDKGKCTWQQVMEEINRVHAVKFRYVSKMYIKQGHTYVQMLRIIERNNWKEIHRVRY